MSQNETAAVATKTPRAKTVKPAGTNGKAPVGKDDARLAKDREGAKAAGLSVVHFRILRAIVKAGKALSYRDIEAATGYYSILTAQLRAAHEGSLSSLGLVKEEQHQDENEKTKLYFAATAKGRKLMAK
jgi:hypothetical protein